MEKKHTCFQCSTVWYMLWRILARPTKDSCWTHCTLGTVKGRGAGFMACCLISLPSWGSQLSSYDKQPCLLFQRFQSVVSLLYSGLWSGKTSWQKGVAEESCSPLGGQEVEGRREGQRKRGKREGAEEGPETRCALQRPNCVTSFLQTRPHLLKLPLLS